MLELVGKEDFLKIISASEKGIWKSNGNAVGFHRQRVMPKVRRTEF